MGQYLQCLQEMIGGNRVAWFSPAFQRNGGESGETEVNNTASSLQLNVFLTLTLHVLVVPSCGLVYELRCWVNCP